MSEFFTVLTRTGQAKLANAIATATPLQITHISVGDGNGQAVPVSEAVTALVRETYRGQVNTLTRDAGNPNWAIAEMVIPTDVGGWTVREVGMFDAAGDLIAYGNFPASYKPVIAEGSGKELVVRMYVETSAAAAIQLKIDPTVVLATRAWVVSQLQRAGRIARPANYFMAQI